MRKDPCVTGWETGMKRSWMILLALAIAGFAGSCADTDIGPQYVEISERESGLQFYGPGLAGGYRQFLTGRDNHYVLRTLATYGPKSGGFPFARIFYTETPPDRYFARSIRVEDTLKHWGWFSHKAIETGATEDSVNALGRVEFVTVTADGIACVVWIQAFGMGEGTGAGSRLLNGYYCRGRGPMMTAAEAESIVKLVGHKTYGVVPPPEGWSTAGAPNIEAAAW